MVMIIIITIIIYSFVISVGIGLNKKKLWAWKANWAIIIGEPLMLALSTLIFALNKIPERVSPEEQLNYFIIWLGYFIVMFGILSLLWIWPNYIYFKKRRALFH
jgi:hypothetical protein